MTAALADRWRPPSPPIRRRASWPPGPKRRGRCSSCWPTREATSPHPDDIAVTVYDAIRDEARAWSGRPSDIPPERIVGPREPVRDPLGARTAPRAGHIRSTGPTAGGWALSLSSTSCRARPRVPRSRSREDSLPTSIAPVSLRYRGSGRHAARRRVSPAHARGCPARRRLRRASRRAEGARRLAANRHGLGHRDPRRDPVDPDWSASRRAGPREGSEDGRARPPRAPACCCSAGRRRSGVDSRGRPSDGRGFRSISRSARSRLRRWPRSGPRRRRSSTRRPARAALRARRCCALSRSTCSPGSSWRASSWRSPGCWRSPSTPRRWMSATSRSTRGTAPGSCGSRASWRCTWRRSGRRRWS